MTSLQNRTPTNHSPPSNKSNSPPTASRGRNLSSKKPSPNNNGHSLPPGTRIIQELFQDYNEIGYKQSMTELDAAMEADKCKVIVIEPLRLGDETARWIGVGNFLHKTTVIAGIGSVLGVGLFPRHWYIWSPLALLSASSYSLYFFSWQSDPACQYQVERDPQKLADLRLNNLNTHSVVVLARKDDTRRRILHTTVVTTAVIAVGFQLYNNFFKAK